MTEMDTAPIYLYKELSKQRKEIAALRTYVEQLELLQLPKLGFKTTNSFLIYKYGCCQSCGNNDQATLCFDSTGKRCLVCGTLESKSEMHRTGRYLEDHQL